MQGATTAANVDLNNRQLHLKEIDWIKANAKAFARQQCGCANPTAEQSAQAEQRLAQQALKNVDLLWRGTLTNGDDQAALQFLAR